MSGTMPKEKQDAYDETNPIFLLFGFQIQHLMIFGIVKLP